MLRPQYVKNEKTKRRQKFLIIGLSIVLVITGGYGLFHIIKSQYLPLTYPVCSYSQKQIVERFKEPFFDEVLLEDYFFYGETLNLKEQPYNIFNNDSSVGKTAIFRNVCDKNQESVFIMDQKVDRQIALESLKDGFYEVFLQDNLINYRTYFDEAFTTTFYTVRRDNQVKEIELIANKDLFDDEKNPDVLAKNYLFVKVSSVEPKDQIFDVILNPGYLDQDLDWQFAAESRTHGLKADHEIYLIATGLKKELEAYGLKVLLTRDDDEYLYTYGENGRLMRGYQSFAKFFIDLRFSDSTSNSTFSVIHSRFSSVSFASSISEHLRYATDLTPLQTGRYPGINTVALASGYEGNYILREAGGKALAAASFSNKALENASFALDNRFGMQAISIRFGDLKNANFVASLKNNRDLYLKETARAIANYLQINPEN